MNHNLKCPKCNGVNVKLTYKNIKNFNLICIFSNCLYAFDSHFHCKCIRCGYKWAVKGEK